MSGRVSSKTSHVLLQSAVWSVFISAPRPSWLLPLALMVARPLAVAKLQMLEPSDMPSVMRGATGFHRCFGRPTSDCGPSVNLLSLLRVIVLILDSALSTRSIDLHPSILLLPVLHNSLQQADKRHVHSTPRLQPPPHPSQSTPALGPIRPRNTQGHSLIVNTVKT